MIVIESTYEKSCSYISMKNVPTKNITIAQKSITADRA